MPLDTPFTLGPFSVDADGRLSPTSEGRFPAFNLRWRGQTMDVAMSRDAAEHAGQLVFSLRAGRIGSTADAAPSVSQRQRDRAFRILRALDPLLPAGWRLTLGADHTIRLVANRPAAMPTSAVGLLTEVTLALLAAQPYLDVLAAEGIVPGSAKTCPG